MPIVTHNPPGLFAPYRAYSHAVEVRGATRLLVISGLNGYQADGVTMPESFAYLADPADDEANVRMRVKHLRGHAPSSTVICCRLLDPRWKLEIEAMAAK